MIETNPVRM